MKSYLGVLVFLLIAVGRASAGAGEIAKLYEVAVKEQGGSPKTPYRDYVAEPKTGGVSEIGIERSYCYGTCPVYSVLIKSDGTFRYHGQAFVERIGNFTGTVNRPQFANVAKFVKDSGYTELANDYPGSITDHSTVYTTVVLDGKRKVIRNYANAGPSSLWAVEQLIDKVLLDAEWDARPAGSASTTAPSTTRPAAMTRGATTHRAAVPVPIKGVGNFADVAPGLYRGEQPTAEGFIELRRLGIKTVVSLRSFHGDSGLLKAGNVTELQYIRIPAKAWHPEDEDVEAFLKVVENPENRPVFVHCLHGADRTGYVVAVYRMIEEGWTVDEALEEMKNFHFHPIWWQIPVYLKRLDLEAMRERVRTADAPKLRIGQD